MMALVGRMMREPVAWRALWSAFLTRPSAACITTGRCPYLVLGYIRLEGWLPWRRYRRGFDFGAVLAGGLLPAWCWRSRRRRWCGGPTAARISAESRAGQGRARSSGRSPSPCPRGAPVRDPRCRGRKAPSACTRPAMQWPLSSRWASDCSPRRLEWAIMPPAPIGPRKFRRGNQADLLALSAGLIVVAISSGCRLDCRGACGMGGGR
jgi:hypothetical protein